MKRPSGTVWFPVFLILLSSGALPMEGDRPADGIWNQAVALAARNANWVPSDVYLRVEELNRSGLVKNIRETWMKVSIDDSNRLKPEVVRALKNGEDVTDEVREKRRRKATAGGEGNDLTVRVTTPFDPDVREEVTFSATGERRMISRSRCVGFDFTQEVEPSKGKPFRLRGKAWLDERTGAPLLMTFTLEPLPLGVKQIENTVRFEFQGSERWYPQSVETEGTAGFLFIRKKFRTRMEFSGYGREEPGRIGDKEAVPDSKR